MSGGLASVSATNHGFSFPPNSSDYVATITIAEGGVITTTPKDTGAATDPIMTGRLRSQCDVGDQLDLHRVRHGSRKYVPAECR